MFTFIVIITFLVILMAIYLIFKIFDMGFTLSPNCPECELKLPAFRTPSSFDQAMWGGWNCESCGCEIDRKGNKIIVENNYQTSSKQLDNSKIDIPVFFDNKGKTPVERVFEEDNKGKS